MNYEVYFDSPSLYSDKYSFYSTGSSPLLLNKLINYLKGVENELVEVDIALYLFNNAILNDYLITLSRKGVIINIVTIPIEGYDAEKPQKIIDIKSGKTLVKETKYGLARKIFADHFRRIYKNVNLFFFPHIYLRSKNVKQFSRGNMPYSLHTKSILVKKKNGEMDLCMSSSNFAVRDLVKEENLLIIKGENPYVTAAVGFFNEILKTSINICDFDFSGDYTSYKIEYFKKELNLYSDFTAPFYYNSPFSIEDYIKRKLRGAKQRIIVAAQHICPISHTIDKNFHTEFYGKPEVLRPGLVNELIERANMGVPVSILSQTFASGNFEFDKKFRAPANKRSFIEFFNLIKDIKGLSYAVNEDVHSKYIIIDDTIFITTFNFTPTEFIYLDNVKIPKFENNEGRSYYGIFSEVGQFVFIENKSLVEIYLDNFKNILAKKNTVKVK